MRPLRALVNKIPAPPLVRFSLSSAAEMTGRLLLLCAVAAIAFATYSGVYSALSSVTQARATWYDQGRIPAMEVRYDSSTEVEPDKLGDVAHVTAITSREITLGSTDVSDQDDLAVTLVETPAATSTQDVGDLVIIDGERVSTDDSSGALIGDEMARYHHVQVGDKLKVDVGDDTRTVEVRGIVRDAEHLISPLNPSLFVSAKGSMGMVYVAEDDDTEPNSTVIQIDSAARPDDVRDAILDGAEDDGLAHAYVLTIDEQFDYQYVDKNLDIFHIILPILVAIGGLSAAFVSVFLSAQWVGRIRQQVAVLLALGYRRGAVALSFAAPYLVLAAVSIAAGAAMAVVIGQGFLTTFTETVGLPSVFLQLSGRDLGLASAAVVLIFALGAGIALSRILSMSPREAMAQARPTQQTSVVSRVATVIGWAPARIAVGNLLRTPLVTGVAVLSIAVGFGLTAAFFLSYSNVMATSVDSVDQNEWDVMVDFGQPMTVADADDIMETNDIARWTPYVKAVAQGRSNGESETLLIGGFDPYNHWHKVTILEGGDIDPGEDEGVVLESGVAADLDLAVGDTFEITTGSDSYDVELLGTMSSALPGEARFPLHLARSVSGLDWLMTGSMVQLPGPNDPSPAAAAEDLSTEDEVKQALTKQEISTLVVESNDQITALLWMGALMSILVALLLVSACLGYTILNRQDEYRLLSLIGFKDRAVRSIVVLEATLLGVVSVALAVPISLAISGFLNRQISQTWFHVDSVVELEPLLQTFIPGLILLPVLALPLARVVLPRRSLIGRARQIG